KRGVIYSLVAFLLSDVVFHEKNLILIINILLDNDYPFSFIFDTINQRIKLLQRNRQISHVEKANQLENKKAVSWLTVPFIPFHTKKFKRFNNDEIKVSFHSPNKMGKCIKVQKDSLSHTSKSNVVYRIQCNDCDASYVGQTGRQLKTRINEHRSHIRHNTSNRSVITDHRLQYDHDFQWEDVKILDEEPNYRKRIISEMLNIKKQKNSLNLQTDTGVLSHGTENGIGTRNRKSEMVGATNQHRSVPILSSLAPHGAYFSETEIFRTLSVNGDH
ncbi:hypothetical protein ALC62_14621, partial [Cyphomyrmex costatus]